MRCPRCGWSADGVGTAIIEWLTNLLDDRVPGWLELRLVFGKRDMLGTVVWRYEFTQEECAEGAPKIKTARIVEIAKQFKAKAEQDCEGRRETTRYNLLAWDKYRSAEPVARLSLTLDPFPCIDGAR